MEKKPWFEISGLKYYPASWEGWLSFVLIIYLAYFTFVRDVKDFYKYSQLEMISGFWTPFILLMLLYVFLIYGVTNESNKLWFKAKIFGWGWYPSSWQGWLSLAIYIYLAFDIAKDVEKYSSFNEIFSNFLLPLVALTTFLLLICYGTGEKPGWRWGIKKD